METTAYRIYTEYDGADTCRDPSDIHTEELCYKNSLENAIKFAEDYIKKHFCSKNIDLIKYKDGNFFSATDFCSYGKSIYIDEVKIN